VYSLIQPRLGSARLGSIRDTAACWTWRHFMGVDRDRDSSGSMHQHGLVQHLICARSRCLQLPRPSAQTAVQQSWASSAL